MSTSFVRFRTNRDESMINFIGKKVSSVCLLFLFFSVFLRGRVIGKRNNMKKT